MAPAAFVAPTALSTDVFKDNLFKGKVLFCTGGGSGICRGMTEAMVCLFPSFHNRASVMLMYCTV
jgi:peroxisomal 2,4-dienoyl-CoA reductase